MHFAQIYNNNNNNNDNAAMMQREFCVRGRLYIQPYTHTAHTIHTHCSIRSKKRKTNLARAHNLFTTAKLFIPSSSRKSSLRLGLSCTLFSQMSRELDIHKLNVHT